MQKLKIHSKIQNWLVVCVLIFYAVPTFAARLFIEPSRTAATVGEFFEVQVLLNTGGEVVNAVEGKLVFPATAFSIRGLRYENSAIGLWIEKPREQNPGSVIFSGVVPGGLHAREVFLFSAIFEAKTAGEARAAMEDATVLLGDGKGTETNVTLSGVSITAQEGGFWESESSRALRGKLSYANDREPPETFIPVIGRSRGIFGGQYFVAFETQDKQSGIERYEAQETRLDLPEEGKWIMAESPFALSDQQLGSFIFIKAVDKEGNERIASIPPVPVDSRAYLTRILSGIIILLLAFFCARMHSAKIGI